MAVDNWHCVLKLNEQREVVGGSVKAFADAVKRGADIRSYTTFDYTEHMSAPESREGLVQELMSFATVYWLDGGHVAGIQTTRYPADCALGFGDVPSLSFFLNNENGKNGIARPFLDGRLGQPKPSGDPQEGKYKVIDSWDQTSPCPCENFTYDFGEYGWWVNDTWEEVLSHDADGTVIQGSLDKLQQAFRSGRSLKVGVKDLCAELATEGTSPIPHEVFVELHSIYNHHDSGFLGGESQPLVRVGPAVPLKYRTGNWNYGWILPRTDGLVSQLVIDPYKHEFKRTQGRFAIRWFVK